MTQRTNPNSGGLQQISSQAPKNMVQPLQNHNPARFGNVVGQPPPPPPPPPAIPLVDRPVGTGSDGVNLEIPKIIPVFAVPPGGSAVPLATPIPDPSHVSIDFKIPQGAYGTFVMLGWYAIFCRPGEGENAGNYPLVWMDPDAGVSSDIEGNPVDPPFFVGAREGCNILYSLNIAEENIVVAHHGHYKDNWRLLPFPIEVPGGAKGRLTVTRLNCQRFAPDETVYLYFGIFGRQRTVLPPPFEVTSCDQPTRLISYTTGRLEVPADNTLGLGTLSRAVSREISITNRHPTLIDGMIHTGADHLMVKVSWQQGSMMEDWVPARLLNFLRSGRTPAPILVSAPTNLKVDYTQPLVVPNQPSYFAALDVEGGAYGW